MLYSSPNFKISAFCKQWAICSHGLQAKKYSNLLQNCSPNSTHKPKPPTWYAAVMPTCRTETGPDQGDLQKNVRLPTCTHEGRYRLWLTGAGVRKLVLQTQLGERKQHKLQLLASMCFRARLPPAHRGKAANPFISLLGLLLQSVLWRGRRNVDLQCWPHPVCALGGAWLFGMETMTGWLQRL